MAGSGTGTARSREAGLRLPLDTGGVAKGTRVWTGYRLPRRTGHTGRMQETANAAASAARGNSRRLCTLERESDNTGSLSALHVHPAHMD